MNEVGPSLPSSSSEPIVTTASKLIKEQEYVVSTQSFHKIYSGLIRFLHILAVPQYQKACCLEKGIPDICLGLCMGACIETPGEMAVSDNICTEHQQAARECCKKEKGK